MAMLVPNRGDDEFGNNAAERDVYKQLGRVLPNTAVVVHGYRYTTYRNDGSRDGECDFIVLIPHVGTCFVEVKGARRFRYTDAAWHRFRPNGEIERMDDPFEQAMRNKHQVTNLIKQHLRLQYYPGPYAHLVVFPRGRLVGEMPAAQPRNLLVTEPEMPNLAQTIYDAIKSSDPRQLAFNAIDAKRVKECLCEAGELIPNVVDEADSDLGRIEFLTREQSLSLNALSMQRVVINGPAGSGKTMLAMRRAIADYDREGGRVLFTCFNKNLAEWLRIELGDHRNNVGRPLVIAMAGGLRFFIFTIFVVDWW